VLLFDGVVPCMQATLQAPVSCTVYDLWIMQVIRCTFTALRLKHFPHPGRWVRSPFGWSLSSTTTLPQVILVHRVCEPACTAQALAAHMAGCAVDRKAPKHQESSKTANVVTNGGRNSYNY